MEVALGDSGETITLMTSTAGGYTLNGKPLSGGNVTAENGDTYRVDLGESGWTATKVER